MRRAPAGIVIAVMLAGCRPPAPAVTPAPPPEAAAPVRSDVTVHHISLLNGFYTIDVLVPNAFPPPRPAVITLLGEEDAMLDAGIAVVKYKVHWELLKRLGAKPPAPASSPPPKTYGKWLLASPNPRTIGEGYFRLLSTNAEGTLPTIIDAVVGLPDIDARRLGIAGSSTNGFTALQALAVDRRLTAATAVSACGDYHRFLQRSTLAMDGGPLDLDPEYEGWLHGREPVRHPERIVHAALLMVNGSDDRAIPLSCVRETERVFRAAYRKARASRRFRAVLLEGEGHNIVQQARGEMLAWWRRWLLRPPGRRAVRRAAGSP